MLTVVPEDGTLHGRDVDDSLGVCETTDQRRPDEHASHANSHLQMATVDEEEGKSVGATPKTLGTDLQRPTLQEDALSSRNDAGTREEERLQK